MEGVALALLASVLLGVSDFLGGVLSRSTKLVTVLVISQVVGSLAILPQLFSGDPVPNWTSALFWGVSGGLATAVAVSSLFKALAIGTMGVVAPITSLSVLVPVAVGLATGDRVSWVVVVGLTLAVVGTVAAGGPEVRNPTPGHGTKPLVLAVVAALAFGFANLSVALGSAHNVTTTLVSNALTVLVVYVAAAVVLRTLPRVSGKPLLGTVAIGLLGIAAMVCFALASTLGALTVVAVLASLYPVVTVLLSRRLLGERLKRIQVAGIIAVFVGVAVAAAAM